ncbi:MAG TPA: cyclodeaminase/cyclohydrolase family protein [Bryobacteraceae bacterium]|jgi:formiminotetrahydrofolate cyclodeaminase
MPPSVWESNLEEFREKVSSADTSVAAVAVATVSAASALGLIVMVLEIIGKRKDFKGDRHRLEALVEAAREESDRLARYADEDPAAYAAYMRARQLPKNTDDERRARSRAMAAALRRATDVPLAAARTAVAGLNICAEAAGMANGAVATDLAGAAMLLAGATRAMLLSVDSNLGALGESEYADQVAAERGDLEQSATRQEIAVRKRVAAL